ncbi:hypothetical protein P43SY_008208 [Pythium insidiosum]|uniref:glucan endo-1,3-beta-D-glucosidase n=1 Tax=Pythium insidiosum TaxID=114742 RepID=A0AAD5LZV6_PYTIN|nr:hypothetical protein P43SY_008208 [Pythium insidiosum]
MRVFSSPLAAGAALVAVGVVSSGAASAQELINGVRLYGINYNPRKDAHWLPNWQACKNDWEVRQDFEMLRRLTDRVRIYGLADCEQGRQVVTLAKQYGLQVHLGLWTSKDRGTFDADFSRLQDLVRDGLVDGNVVGVHVGSEAIYREDVKPNDAIDYFYRVRNLLRDRGIQTPVTITDVVDVYYNNPQLLDHVDYVSVNQFSFWEKKEPAEAVTSTLNRLRAIRDLAASKNKEFVLSETGWATAGQNEDTSETSNEASAEFFRNFYHQARARDLKYYYFGSFDANWRLKESGKEVEIHFGLIYENRDLKEPFRQFNAGRRELLNIRARTTGLLVAEELAGGDMAHVKEYVRLAEPSDNWLEREQAGWFFDRDTRQIRSLHDDRCLDAYQPTNGGAVHLWKCLPNENNQKWEYDAGTGKLRHAHHHNFCLDNDPDQNNKLQLWECSWGNANQEWDLIKPGAAGNSAGLVLRTKESLAQLVRRGNKLALEYGAGVLPDAQWTYDSASGLIRAKDSDFCIDAYEPWNGGTVHTWQCNSNERNQRWDFNSATGQFVHRELKMDGRVAMCLDADRQASKVQLWSCHDMNQDADAWWKNNQAWRPVSASARLFKLMNDDRSVVEYVDKTNLVGKPASKSDAQLWLFDSAKKSIISKWNGECLDGYEAKENGAVHMWGCNGNDNQKWTYNSGEKRFHKASNADYCLAYGGGKKLVVKRCNLNDASQTFVFGSVE